MIRPFTMVRTLASVVIAQPATAQGVPNVVRVHRAWAEGSSGPKVLPLLEKVVAVQNPFAFLGDDVAATRRAIVLQGGPVIRVGHLWAVASSPKSASIGRKRAS